MFNRLLSFLKKYFHRAYLVGFIVAFFAILILPLTRINYEIKSKLENRNLAKAAVLFQKGKLNKNFGKDFEAWLNDRFRGRIKLVNAYTKVNKFIVNRLENNRAMRGKDGFLFYKGDNSVANYQNKNLFKQEELEKIKSNILKRKTALAKQGIQYYVMIAPDKNRIYGENYPTYIGKYNSQGRAEQLVAYLESNGIDVIYPKQGLLDSKGEGTLYYRLDTHWNNYGALKGYIAIMKDIANDNKHIQYLTYDNFNIQSVPEKGGDLLNMLNIKVPDVGIPENKILSLVPKEKYHYRYLKNEGTKGVETENATPLNNLRLLMLRDSFTSAMEPFFSETFSHSLYIWNHNFNVHYDKILQYKPDIVISEMVERYATTLLIDNPPLLVEANIDPQFEINNYTLSEKKLTYYVDEKKNIAKDIVLRGWAFLNAKFTNTQEVYIINTDSNDNLRAFKTELVIRDDVGKHFKEPLCKYAGFSIKINKNDLLDGGKLKLVVLNGNQIAYSSEIMKY